MIIVALVTVLVAFVFCKYAIGSFWFPYVVLGLITGLMVGFMFSIVVGEFLSSGPEKTVESLPLHNLYDDSRLEGRFFLGIGDISQPDYYFYNVESSRGYSPEKMYKYHGDVFVREDGGDSPWLEKICAKKVGSPLWGIADPDCYFVFHIPVGGLDTSYQVH